MNNGSLVLCSSIGLALAAGSTNCTITTGNGGTGGSTSTGIGGSSGAGVGGSAGTSGTAGTGGAGGSGGTALSDAAVIPDDTSIDSGIPDSPAPFLDSGSDPCTAADPGNNDRDHTTAYSLNAEFRACLQTADDLDFYEFTTPATPAGGGVVTVYLTDVGIGGGVDSTAYATSDNGEIQQNYDSQGTSVFYWFAALPSTRYRVSVKSYVQGAMPNAYTFKAAYLPVDDVNEPNDLRAQAKTIAPGSTVHGFFFNGLSTSTTPGEAPWEDWFKVTLAAGTAQITLADVSTALYGTFTLYDSNGSAVGDTASGTDLGSSVVASRTALNAGDYFLKVLPYLVPNPRGVGSLPPNYATQAYSLTISQP